MINKTVWSEEYSSYVSHSFISKAEKAIKLDITKCIIKITMFGYYELWLNNNKVKSLNFNEFQKYKQYVKEVNTEEVYVI